MNESQTAEVPTETPDDASAQPETALVISNPGSGLAIPRASNKVRAEKLTPTARREFKEAIQRRSRSMLEALNGSIGGDVDAIIQNLRLRSGIKLTEAQLKELIKGCDDQIQAEVNSHLGPEKRRIEAEILTINDDYDGKEREMKARHKKEWSDLGKERKAKQAELQHRLAGAEENVRKSHTARILEKKQDYMAELARVREVEATITSAADQQVRLIKNRKGQLKNLVEDATSRALEQLLMVETRNDANTLVLMIPTVQTALHLAGTSRGLSELMHMLDDTIPIEKPEPEVEPLKEDHDTHDGEVVDATVIGVARNITLTSDGDDEEDAEDAETGFDVEDNAELPPHRQPLDITDDRTPTGTVVLNGLDARSDDQFGREHDEIYADDADRTINLNRRNAVTSRSW